VFLANVSFGIIALTPCGWLFMAAIVYLEAVLISRYFFGENYTGQGLRISIISNLVSGLAGFLLSLQLNGGWWLVVWFPWVSAHEVYRDQQQLFLLYFAASLVLTLVIELFTNWFQLRRSQPIGKILIGTLLINTLSTLLAATFLYAFSFSGSPD
jgi:hypothetical protein